MCGSLFAEKILEKFYFCNTFVTESYKVKKDILFGVKRGDDNFKAWKQKEKNYDAGCLNVLLKALQSRKRF